MSNGIHNAGSSTGRSVATSAPYLLQKVEEFTVVEFCIPSLMDALDLEKISQSLYRLIDEEDRRQIILDFEKVQYLSSQAIGIVMTIHKKLSQLKESKLILCGVGPKLQELLKITRLDRILKVTASQKEALKVK
jgi:anti-sigma B factor antagonist